MVKLSVPCSVTMLPTGGYDVYDICYISMLPACDRPVIPVLYLYVIIAIGQMGFSRQLSSAEIFEQVPILDITVTLVVYPFNVYVLL